MKNRIAFVSGVVFYILLSFMLSGYDNATMHTYINEKIADLFINSLPSDARTKNYTIQPNATVKGEGVVTPGYYYHTEGTVNKTFKEWIQHGGFSADEPELLQALRHFYDPKGLDAGKRYLTNFPPGLSVANPYVDILSWALEYNGEVTNGTDGANYLFQEHSWEDGKRSFLLAMKETDPVKQDKLMAHAWRSLGESIHALGDMTCPVHVRNDGHPTGDADPYENGIKLATYLPSNPQNFWDQALISKMKGRDSIRQIFHDLALYTNENFFTNQTIYGDGVGPIKPSLRPTNPYPLPYAKESGGGWDYIPEEFTYYRSFGNNMIKMCKDRYYFAGAAATNYRTASAYVDLDVAISQSQVLLSNLVGIGPEVMKRFIPEISVTVDGIYTQSGEVYGSVQIAKNVEYPLTNVYKSNVTVWNLTKNKTVVTTAVNGYYSTLDLDFSEGDEIQAYVTLGGLQVNSAKTKAGGSLLKQFIEKSNDVFMAFELQKAKLSTGEVRYFGFSSVTNSGEWVKPWNKVDYTLSGQNLVIKKEFSDIGDTWNDTATDIFTINFSPNFDNILSFNFDHQKRNDSPSNTFTESYSFKILGMPHDVIFGTPGGPNGDDFSRYWIADVNGFQAAIKEFKFERKNVFKSNNYTEIENVESIDWSTPPSFTSNYCWLWFSKVK